MGNFSKDPFQELRRSREKGYVGLHLEQGVPVLDRDLNLLADLVASSVREILSVHIGSGVPERNDAFAIEELREPNEFRIAAPAGGGTCLVAGVQVRIDAPVRYGEQAEVEPLTVPRGADREDLVYLDVWIEEIDAGDDRALANVDDVGVQTSTRLRPDWRVRVAEGQDKLPAPNPGHAHYPLARMRRRADESAIDGASITDLRQTGLNLGELERRVRRIEDFLLSSSLGVSEYRLNPNGSRIAVEGRDDFPAPGRSRDSSHPITPEGGETR